MNWTSIFAAILGEAEAIVPLFIHNPKSQQIEGVIVSTLPGIIQGLQGAGVVTPVPAAPQTPAPPAAPAV